MNCANDRDFIMQTTVLCTTQNQLYKIKILKEIKTDN